HRELVDHRASGAAAPSVERGCVLSTYPLKVAGSPREGSRRAALDRGDQAPPAPAPPAWPPSPAAPAAPELPAVPEAPAAPPPPPTPAHAPPPAAAAGGAAARPAPAVAAGDGRQTSAPPGADRCLAESQSFRRCCPFHGSPRWVHERQARTRMRASISFFP